jgi:methionine sulfoxide reductase heme-binding subunit
MTERLKPNRPNVPRTKYDIFRSETIMANATPARTGPAFRVGVRGAIILIVLIGLVLIYATDQIVPATSDRQAELRFWMAARATGIVSFLLLTLQVVLGLVLSHPTNRSTWNLSKRIFPWHDHLWVFVMAFLIAHIVSLVIDPKAGVSFAGAFIPGLSEYRSSPVAIGTFALYAFFITSITARWTKLLPRGVWLMLHRLALLIFVMAWMHGVLAGTDTPALGALYVGAGLAVTFAGAYRYWASRKRKPTFNTSRQEVPAP